MLTLEQLRERAREHERQLKAVRWASVRDLAARWGVSPGTVRLIPREQLPYLTLGKSAVRRYSPDDVERFENENKQGVCRA
jgi:hypothetical protein